MLQFDQPIIPIIDSAYKCGYNLPEKHFKNSTDFDLSGENVFENYPLYIVKPEGIEFSYLSYYSGKNFYGGYVSINNNYTSVQRGSFSRNGETLFFSNILEIKKCFKKSGKKGWMIQDFILGDNGKIYFWGNNNIEHYHEPMKVLTGLPFDELTEKFKNGERIIKPEGFVSSVMIKSVGVNRFILTNDKPYSTVTGAWKSLYGQCEQLEKAYEYTEGMEKYMRTAYARLKKSDKLF